MNMLIFLAMNLIMNCHVCVGGCVFVCVCAQHFCRNYTDSYIYSSSPTQIKAVIIPIACHFAFSSI